MKRLLLIALCLALSTPALAGRCRLERQAFAPAEDLEAIDVELIGQAKKRIDFAAYVLTDLRIVKALDDAAARGVRIRLYRDGADVHMPKALAEVYDSLAARPNVEIRYKGEPAPLMHLKAYSVDGKFMRDGAGNFSHSGLTRQDNSLIVLRCRAAVKRFKRAFEDMWRR
ncbi:MAG: phosphatidylserine synthase [Hyphomicrobiales bacterium]|nr:MAG: phosphatidylserine synthase [Hyphomicrobiales bacterium]